MTKVKISRLIGYIFVSFIFLPTPSLTKPHKFNTTGITMLTIVKKKPKYQKKKTITTKLTIIKTQNPIAATLFSLMHGCQFFVFDLLHHPLFNSGSSCRPTFGRGSALMQPYESTQRINVRGYILEDNGEHGRRYKAQ